MTRISILIFPYLIFKRVFRIFIAFLCFSLSIFYIFQIGCFTSENYKINMYQQELDRMVQENERLETGFARERGMGNLEQLVRNLSFEEIEQIYYITPSKGPVVSK